MRAIDKADSRETDSKANLLSKLTLLMHSLFIYMLKIKCARTKIQVRAKLLRICPVWIRLYALNRWLIILLVTLPWGKMKTRHFCGWPTRKNWKINWSVGGPKRKIFQVPVILKTFHLQKTYGASKNKSTSFILQLCY